MKKKFANLYLVLVEPKGPLNIGSIARLCANFDVNELRIVSPKCNIISLEAKKMALRGQRYLDKCLIFNSIEEAIFDCDLIIATCGRNEIGKDSNFESPEVISKWILNFDQVKSLAILFGREDQGLNNNELLLAHKVLNIPTSQKYSSLNISHAVAIILYELNKSFNENLEKEKEIFNLASPKEIKDSFLEIEEMLIKVGYLLEHTSIAKISKFKKYIFRASTTTHEMNTIRGIIHQIKWYLNNSRDN